MFVASYRNTEAGAKLRMSERLRTERVERMKAQRAAWDAEMKVIELKRQLQEQAAQRAALAALSRQRAGILYQHTFREIERRACKLFKLTRQQLLSSRRNKEVAFARQFVMYWTARLTKHSLPQMGRLMGGRDHTTCLHGKRAYVEKRAKMGRTLRPAR